LPSEGEHHSAYDPALVDAILGEAAHLLRHLGFAAAHTVLIGGVVPSLLVLDPATHRRHLGTTDLDFCLSLAIVEGDTAEYERIETALRRAGYEETEDTFRWRQTSRLRLAVEFFCPAASDRPAGRIFRPKAADNPTAKQNFGPRLGAISLDAGSAIGEDVVVVTREVDLPDDAGRTRFDFRVTGVLGFLVAKTGALLLRDKPKDAYDIVWIIENWEGGPAGVANTVTRSNIFGRADVTAAFDRLFEEFGDIGRLGPRSYVRFMADEGMPADDRARLARQAVGAIAELRRLLRPNPS
jgi:hypothetical protein